MKKIISSQIYYLLLIGFVALATTSCETLVAPKKLPVLSTETTKDAAGTGKFVSNLNNLLPDTTYYVRAYATNSDGTAYGLQVTFRTLKGILPLLSTTKAINLTDISATSGGNITFNGGTIISERGVCWSTNQNPTRTLCVVYFSINFEFWTTNLVAF